MLLKIIIYNNSLKMEVSQLAKLKVQQKKLKQRRGELIRNQFKKKQKEKVNLNQQSVKKGYIQKHKIIAKKTFETIVQKGRKIAIELQENVNVNTFLSESANYKKTLARTQQRIQLQQKIYHEGLLAINSFAKLNKQYIINFTLQFQNQIQCEPRPFIINIPSPQKFRNVIIVLSQIKEKQDSYAFQSIKELNLTVMTHHQFIHKFNNDKMFSKQLFQQENKCFVKFQTFKKHKFYQNLLKKGIPIFPIDIKKVPFCLQDTISSYPQYIEYMSQHYYCITKTGQQQIFRLKAGELQGVKSNGKAILWSLVAKLIERSKVKHNKLLRVSVKTASSINFQIYKAQ